MSSATEDWFSLELLWNDADRTETKHSEEHLPHFHFVYHRSHVDGLALFTCLRGKRPTTDRPTQPRHSPKPVRTHKMNKITANVTDDGEGLGEDYTAQGRPTAALICSVSISEAADTADRRTDGQNCLLSAA